jgi:hypothetical protein
MPVKNDIQHCIKRMVDLVEEIIKTTVMVKGYYSTVYRKCGKPTCWCASEAKGHISTRITWNEHGVSRMRSVKKEDHERLLKATESYRNYRQQRRKLKQETAMLENLLDNFEKEVTTKK